MAVRLESATKRFIGLSTDTKPIDEVPSGSSFLESDTGHIYRLNGTEWYHAKEEQTTNALLEVVASELQLIRVLMQENL